MRFNAALARRVALILGLSFPTFCNALADGRAVLPPRWMVDAYLSDAVVKPSRDDIARAIIPGLGMVPAFLGGANDGPAATFVGVSANGNGTTVAMPSGWAVGDLLIIAATAYKGGTNTTGHDTPPGWNFLVSFSCEFEGGGYDGRTKIFWRIAQSGDSTVSLTVSDGSSRYASYMVAYRGVNVSDPFESVSTLNREAASPANGSLPYDQITTLGINRVVLQFFQAWSGGAADWTPGASWTERYDSGAALSVTMNERTFASAGQVPSGTVTTGDLPWGRLALAIKPALI